MGVYIKGINAKEIKIGAVGYLNIDNVLYFVQDGTIIPVPDHGRLVDADDVIAESRSGNYWWETEEEIPGLINEVPTIIPAERSEE